MIIQQKCDHKATYISTGFRKRGSWREKGEGKLKEKKNLATDRIWGIFLEPFREIPARGWDEDRVRVDILTACTSLIADRQTATPFTLHVFIQ